MENVGQALMQRRLTPNTDRLKIVGKELEEHGPISCTSLSIIRSVLWDVKVTFSNIYESHLLVIIAEFPTDG